MCLRRTTQGIQLSVKVKPNAKKDQVIEIANQYLVIAVAAPPIEGRVNQRLLKIVAKITKTPIRQISILRGKHSRYKELLLPDGGQWEWLSTLPIES